MAARKNPPTEFGLECLMYCAQKGITQAELAKIAGVSYETLKDARRGKRPGRAAVEAVRKVINR